jgi:hypothetical protein
MNNFIAANETATCPCGITCSATAGAACTCPGYAGREVAVGGEGFIIKELLVLAVIATIAFASRILLRMRRSRT